MYLSTAPAIIDPGDNTTTDVPEDGIRYFQVECDSFSNRVLVELYDNTGTSFLYCSATEKNPGPLTSDTVSDTSVDTSIRTCEVLLANADSKVSSYNIILLKFVVTNFGLKLHYFVQLDEDLCRSAHKIYVHIIYNYA